jgi:hypothetical protein
VFYALLSVSGKCESTESKDYISVNENIPIFCNKILGSRHLPENNILYKKEVSKLNSNIIKGEYYLRKHTVPSLTLFHIMGILTEESKGSENDLT